MKRERIDILRDLIGFKGNIASLKEELSLYPWDSSQSLLTLTNSNMLLILHSCLSNNINLEDLILWANLIENRDDIDFENPGLQELIFDLASPEINGEITRGSLIEIIKKLSDTASIY
jgi:hypothetical protein